uniref:Uncharacterized protein n=1 Tax=Magallana gigas TaxID=29159 RepID=K1RTS8_MAGGI
MEEGTVIYSKELFDPTDVNDFRNRRVLIDLQEKTPSISFYIAKEDAYIASLTGIIKSNRTKFLLIVPNKRVMKEILKHIFKLTGQLYEDIPIVFRQSHITRDLSTLHTMMTTKYI